MRVNFPASKVRRHKYGPTNWRQTRRLRGAALPSQSLAQHCIAHGATRIAPRQSLPVQPVTQGVHMACESLCRPGDNILRDLAALFSEAPNLYSQSCNAGTHLTEIGIPFLKSGTAERCFLRPSLKAEKRDTKPLSFSTRPSRQCENRANARRPIQ